MPQLATTGVYTMDSSAYPASFYQKLLASRPSAVRITSCLLDIVRPRSVVDVGCGVGVFLSTFRERGIEDVLGIDLPPPDPSFLQIPAEKFVACDLNKKYSPERRFDLALSFEVAEHLAPASAERFVDTLTELAPVVAFSAAIPRQGGYEHRNEQWQDWWANLFLARGYRAVDCIRDKIWNDEDVAVYYRQNLIVYAREAALASNEALRVAYERTQGNSLSRVHPEMYMAKAEPQQATARFMLSALPHLPGALCRAVARRFGR